MKKKNILKYLLSFLIPFSILVLFCISRKIGIFGKYSLLISDFQSQYINLLDYLRNGESLTYSFSKGIGGGMIGTFAYYLASPLNLLIYLFPKDQIVLASIVLIILKISICGLMMYIYLTNHFKSKRNIFLVFSTCYSLMAFVVNYHFHIMWLDGVFLLPLVMTGIDKLFEKKSALYIFSLFFAIYSNYYIGYMICIMCVLYFFGNLFLKYTWKENRKEIISITKKFIICSLLAGFMTMIIMVPNILELKNGYKANNVTVNYSGLNLSFFDFWSRTYIGSHNYEQLLAKDLISIYCGLIILPLLYFYFVNKNIKKKEKVAYGGILFLLIIGYFVDAINIIFHGFNLANCFNYRFTFITCFMMIFLACKSFLNVEKIALQHYLIFIAFYVIISNIMIWLNYSYVSTVNIFISCALMMLYLFLLYQYNRYNKNNDLKLLLFIIILAELLFNLFMSLKDFDYYQTAEYEYYNETFGPKLEKLQEDNKEYRISTKVLATYNDSLFMNYHGISTFLSTMDINYMIFLNSTGYYSTGMSVIDYDNNTIVMDSLLGIKYRITSNEKKEYNAIGEIEYPLFSGLLFHKDILKEATIYENPYALSLGYMISNIEEEKKSFENVFEVQNYLLNTMLNNETKYFKPYKKEKIEEGAYEFTIDNNEKVYIYYYFDAIPNECEVLVNGTPVTTRAEIVSYKENLKDQKIRVSLDGKVSNYGEAHAYYLDIESFKQDIETLLNKNVKFETVNNGYLKGSVTVEKEYNRLFLSIPYEKGWTLYVDGKKQEIDMLYGVFMGATLKEGNHEIELKYSVPGIKLGACISGISFLIASVYLFIEQKSKKKVK